MSNVDRLYWATIAGLIIAIAALLLVTLPQLLQ